MKKILFILFSLIILIPTVVSAQVNLLGTDNNQTGITKKWNKNNSKKEKNIEENTPLKDTYFSGFIEDIEAEKKAKEKARIMLKSDPKIIKLRKSQLNELEKNKAEREKIRQKFIDLEKEKMKPEEKIKSIVETFETAPLGLMWAISPDKMQQVGYEIESIDLEDYPNSFIIKNYQHKHNQNYENVIISFGENNQLWRINAQTSAQKDEPTAKETLKLYNKYYEALAEKYGNANEYFSPYTYEEEITEGEGKEAITRIIKKENPRGNPNFLKELQTGKADLYATFHDNNIGVTLSVYINEDNEGLLILDYKNLQLMKKEKESFINIL